MHGDFVAPGKVTGGDTANNKKSRSTIKVPEAVGGCCGESAVVTGTFAGSEVDRVVKTVVAKDTHEESGAGDTVKGETVRSYDLVSEHVRKSNSEVEGHETSYNHVVKSTGRSKQRGFELT